MNPIWGHLIGAVIVMLMLAFLGVWIWAWLPRHQKTFARLAQVPMEDPLQGNVGRSNSAGGEGASR